MPSGRSTGEISKRPHHRFHKDSFFAYLATCSADGPYPGPAASGKWKSEPPKFPVARIAKQIVNEEQLLPKRCRPIASPNAFTVTSRARLRYHFVLRDSRVLSYYSHVKISFIRIHQSLKLFAYLFRCKVTLIGEVGAL